VCDDSPTHPRTQSAARPGPARRLDEEEKEKECAYRIEDSTDENKRKEKREEKRKEEMRIVQKRREEKKKEKRREEKREEEEKIGTLSAASNRSTTRAKSFASSCTKTKVLVRRREGRGANISKNLDEITSSVES
jgi:hypothetical protein